VEEVIGIGVAGGVCRSAGVSHLLAESTFSRLGASRLLHLYWFRGLQGAIPSKSASREPLTIGLGGSPVTVVTFRSCIPNSTLFHTQLHIHSVAATDNATHHTILHTLSMQGISQRTRVPSRKWDTEVGFICNRRAKIVMLNTVP
jgi:hypothetical protein